LGKDLVALIAAHALEPKDRARRYRPPHAIDISDVSHVPITYPVNNPWALQDSNLRPQPCESAHLHFTAQRGTMVYNLIRNPGHIRRHQKSARDSICGAICGARDERSPWSAEVRQPPFPSFREVQRPRHLALGQCLSFDGLFHFHNRGRRTMM
jgi:hypothetical protein